MRRPRVGVGDGQSADRAIGTESWNVTPVAVGSVPPNPLITTNNLDLGSLVNDGRLARTLVLLAGSPAIDTGNNSAGIPVDQRGPGFARVMGAEAIMGAVERTPDVVSRNGFDSQRRLLNDLSVQR